MRIKIPAAIGDAVRERNLVKRIVFYILGLIVMAFGISMSIRADIGVAPGSTVAYAASRLSPLTIGQCSACFHVFCMLAQLMITRKPKITLLLQLPLAYVFGLLIDIFYDLLIITPPNMLYSILLMLAALFVFSLGIRAIVGADILLAPPDGLARTIGNVFGWPMSKAKLVFDIVATAAAALVTLILAGDVFLAVGVGTIICAAGTGPIIGLFTKLLPFLDLNPGK